jgi:hypothetical protein
MKRTSLILIFVLVAAGACSRPDALSGMELRRDGNGAVSVIRDGETLTVGSKIGIEPGDVIVTGNNAGATFALDGGEDVRSARLLENSRVVVTSPTEIEAVAGDVLVDTKDTIAVVFDDVTASASGSVFRVDRGFGSSRLGTYNGEVGLKAVGQLPLDVQSFFQATVVAGDLPSKAIPYQLRLQDAWDQSILKPQVELEGQLETLGRGLQNQLGTQRPSLVYFGELAGNQPVGFMKEYLQRRPIDLLIGFTIANSAGGDLKTSFEDAFGYFDDGAKWSITSAILDVQPDPIIASLENLIVGTGVVAANGGSAGGQAAFTVAAAEAATSASASDAPPAGSPADPAPDPGGEDPPPNDAGKPQPKECQSGAECDVQEIVDGLPKPTPTPSSAPDLIDGDL